MGLLGAKELRVLNGGMIGDLKYLGGLGSRSLETATIAVSSSISV